MKRYVAHDGIVAERAPQLQVAVLRHLIDVRAALGSAERRAPAELIAAIDRMAPCCASSATATAGSRCSTAPGKAIAP